MIAHIVRGLSPATQDLRYGITSVAPAAFQIGSRGSLQAFPARELLQFHGLEHGVGWRRVQELLDDWHRRTPGAKHLPAVLPVVLHHGPRPWRAPTSLLELTDLSEQARADFAAHLLSLDFVLDDLRTIPDEVIDARPLGPLLRLVLGVMKHCRSPELLAFYLAHAADVSRAVRTASRRASRRASASR